MLKVKNRTALLISTIICLIPMIFALVVFKDLPPQVPIHFNAAGVADNYLPRAATAFGMPLIMAAINAYAHFRLNADPKVENASSVIRQAMKWAVPVVSVLFVPFSLLKALGTNFPIPMAAMSLAGVVIIICGNYLPKCRQNYTVGIKLPWTLDSQTNWKKTHRFAGFLWVFGGLIILVNAFFSFWPVNLAVIVLLVIAPFFYSYFEYQREKMNQAIEQKQ